MHFNTATAVAALMPNLCDGFYMLNCFILPYSSHRASRGAKYKAIIGVLVSKMTLIQDRFCLFFIKSTTDVSSDIRVKSYFSITVLTLFSNPYAERPDIVVWTVEREVVP